MLRGPKSQMHCKNQWFFKIFAISTNLPTRGHMIAILVNMAIKLSPKTLQICSQNRSRSHIKSNAKNHWFFDRLLTAFGWVLASILAPKRGGRGEDERAFSGSCWLLKPRWPPDLSKTDFGAILDPCRPFWNHFEVILGGFVYDFLLHLGWCWIDFLFILLLICVLVCLFVGLLVWRFVGLLVCWFAGLLACWSNGPTIQRHGGGKARRAIGYFSRNLACQSSFLRCLV